MKNCAQFWIHAYPAKELLFICNMSCCDFTPVSSKNHDDVGAFSFVLNSDGGILFRCVVCSVLVAGSSRF